MFEDEPSLGIEQGDRIASLIGNERTIALGEAIKWKKIYIPCLKLKRDHPVVRAIGPLWASILQSEFGGEYISCPKCTLYKIHIRNQEIRAKFEQGMTIGALAKKYDLSSITVSRIIKQRNRREKRGITLGSSRGGWREGGNTPQ